MIDESEHLSLCDAAWVFNQQYVRCYLLVSATSFTHVFADRRFPNHLRLLPSREVQIQALSAEFSWFCALCVCSLTPTS